MINFRTEVIDNYRFAAESIHDALVFSAFSGVLTQNLNATDAIILSSALTFKTALNRIGDDMILCALDLRLARAAQAEQMIVFNPETDSLEHLSI